MKAPTSYDPRGPRTAAGITTVVLAIGLATQSAWVVGAQTIIFALGAAGLSPYQWLFKTFVRPRLSPPGEGEASAPVRFAQAVGFVFGLAGTIGFGASAPIVGYVFTGFALAAAFLNVAFALCVGCELYLLIARAAGRPLSRRVPVS